MSNQRHLFTLKWFGFLWWRIGVMCFLFVLLVSWRLHQHWKFYFWNLRGVWHQRSRIRLIFSNPFRICFDRAAQLFLNKACPYFLCSFYFVLALCFEGVLNIRVSGRFIPPRARVYINLNCAYMLISLFCYHNALKNR